MHKKSNNLHGDRGGNLQVVVGQDVHATGIATAHGLVLTEAFYWDMNDNTRAFAKRFGERMAGSMPNMIHAGDYSAVTHYLKTVKAMGIPKMRESGRAVV